MTTQLKYYCVAIVVCTASLLLWWNFFKPTSYSNTRLQSCQSNLRQIGLAMQQYQQDYGGKFPPAVAGGTRITTEPKMSGGKIAVSTPVGWADGILPQLGSLSLYFCPLSNMTSSGRPNQVGFTCYWFNANLSALPVSRLAFPASTICVGEGGDAGEKTNATYRKSSFPASWLSNRATPAWRHSSGANYLFTDGHVAWRKPQQIIGNDGRTDDLAIK